jgi:hypothetical protein
MELGQRARDLLSQRRSRQWIAAGVSAVVAVGILLVIVEPMSLWILISGALTLAVLGIVVYVAVRLALRRG